MIATIDRSNGATLTFSDIKHALYDGDSSTKTDLDVLRHIFDNKRQNVEEQLLSSPKLLEKFKGRKRVLKREISGLLDRSRDQIQHLAASRDFEKKSGKKGIIRRFASFAARHKVVTALLAFAAAAGGVAGSFYLAGNWELLLANVALLRKQIAGGVGAALPVLDPATKALDGTGLEGVPRGTGITL